MMQLLLISATTDPANMQRTFGDHKRITCVTFARYDSRPMLTILRDTWGPYGYTFTQVRSANDIINAEAILVCGGNTFLLLKALYDRSLLEPLRHVVRNGVPYVGASAGSNIACPTIKTTNDMPIVDPPSLDALGLVPFQINPHYPDVDAQPTPMGETREERLRGYFEVNEIPVIGLREPSALLIKDEKVALLGTVTARLFRKGMDPVELPPGPITIPKSASRTARSQSSPRRAPNRS
jgi:dipeptidase E